MTCRLCLVALMLAARPGVADPTPPPASAPATPSAPACPAVLSAPPPATCPQDGETVESLRSALTCERLRAAAQFERMACELRDVEARIKAMPEPPSRVVWLITGAAAAGIGCALIDPPGR